MKDSVTNIQDQLTYKTVLENSKIQADTIDVVLSSPYWSDDKVVTQEFKESARADWVARYAGALQGLSTDALIWSCYEMTLPLKSDPLGRPIWQHLGGVDDQGHIDSSWTFQEWYDKSIRQHAKSYEYAIPHIVNLMIWIHKNKSLPYSAQQALECLGIGRLKQLSQSKNAILKASKILPLSIFNPEHEFLSLVNQAFDGQDYLVWKMSDLETRDEKIRRFLNADKSGDGVGDIALQENFMPSYHVHQSGDKYSLYMDNLSEAQLLLIEHIIKPYSERSID